MPILSYFAVVGSVLVGLLFVADATLEKRSSPIVPTSSLYGLPRAWHPDPAQTLAVTPAPAPDMSAAAVLAAMPETDISKTDIPKTEPVNVPVATADAAPKKKRVAHKPRQTDDYRRSFAWSPNNRNQFGGGGFYGRL